LFRREVNLLQLSPGAGAMFCGNCLRDNALVAALRDQGHQVLMVPLYLPVTLDESDQSAGMPIFFGGVNVYLEQKSAFFRAAPRWLHGLLSSRHMLDFAAGRAVRTRASGLGELTQSMLRGELGKQVRELDELIAWLKTQPRPDRIFLSNALLLGMARRLRAELGAPVVCMLQGEHSLLDALPEAEREECWRIMSERAAEVDMLVAPSRYFADVMQRRLGVPPARVRVVPNGINLSGYRPGLRAMSDPPDAMSANAAPVAGSPPPVLGYFARMCAEKGLDTLIQAYIRIRQRGRVPGLKLRVGGNCGPLDEEFVNTLRRQLEAAGLRQDTEFCPNLDRAAKVEFLRSLSVFSVPALYGEAFGLYLLEALAAGVPLVQPRSGAFPELIEATGGGILCAPGDAQALADAIEGLLLEPARARALAERGQRAVFEKFSAEAMARGIIAAVQS
jgi:glycosyltransferase involved in cell wall biosynthesis